MVADRKARNRKHATAASAGDLRVVKKLGPKSEREIERGKMRLSASDRIRIKVKALNEKIKAIEKLRERRKAGDKLDDQQLAKIDSLEETLTMLEEYLRQG